MKDEEEKKRRERSGGGPTPLQLITVPGHTLLSHSPRPWGTHRVRATETRTLNSPLLWFCGSESVQASTHVCYRGKKRERERERERERTRERERERKCERLTAAGPGCAEESERGMMGFRVSLFVSLSLSGWNVESRSGFQRVAGSPEGFRLDAVYKGGSIK